MDEFRTAVGVLGAVVVGGLLIGESLASYSYLLFGVSMIGPVSWLREVIGWSL